MSESTKPEMNPSVTQEEKRLKIAAACGWEERPEPPGSTSPKTWWHGPHRYPTYVMPVPDYFNDLNACHEMEKVLNANQQMQFSVELRKLTLSHLPASRAAWMDFKIANACAKYRAEAFGKTLSLW